MTTAGIYRPVTGPLTVRGPYEWACMGGDSFRVKRDPEAVGGYRVPRSWFRALVRSGVTRFGEVLVVVDYVGKLSQCDLRCARAEGSECRCSCLGANHNDAQGGSLSMMLISDTVLVETGVKRRQVIATSVTDISSL